MSQPCSSSLVVIIPWPCLALLILQGGSKTGGESSKFEPVFWSEVTVRRSLNCCPVIARQTRITQIPQHRHMHTWLAFWITAYILSRKNHCSFFTLPFWGTAAVPVGIFTTGRLFAEISLGLFVSKSSLWAPAWNNFNLVLLLFNLTNPDQRYLILAPFKLKLRREKQTKDMKVFDSFSSATCPQLTDSPNASDSWLDL